MQKLPKNNTCTFFYGPRCIMIMCLNTELSAVSTSHQPQFWLIFEAAILLQLIIVSIFHFHVTSVNAWPVQIV